ncbi:tmcA [Symbiodinium microadriaticum]|nr:tmcA [Symbiodinium microadriaticum]
MERPGKTLKDAAFAMIVPGADQEGLPRRGPKPTRAYLTDGFESAKLRQRSNDAVESQASPTNRDARGLGRPAALQPPSSSLGDLSEGSGQGQSGQSQSPRRTFSPARTGRFRFLPESLKTMPVPPVFPSLRNRANAPTAPNDEEDALDWAPESPLSPGRTKRSPKAKAMNQSFYLDRPKPKSRMHQGGASGEQLHLLTIEGFEAPKREAAKDELPSPSSSMKRMVLQEHDAKDVQRARRLSSLYVRGWMQRKDESDSTAEGGANEEEEEEQESPLERLLRLQKELQEALAMHARGVAIELKAMSISEEKEMLELEGLIEEHGLTGKAALAYILCAKLGSLDAAFNYLDGNSSEAFAAVSWHTGLMILRVDLPKIAGLGKQQMFSSITKGGTTVSREAWHEYFAGVEDSLPALPSQLRQKRTAQKPRLPEAPLPPPPPPPPPKPKEPKPEPEPKPEEKKESTGVGWRKLRMATKKLKTLSSFNTMHEEQQQQQQEPQEEDEAFKERVTMQLQGLSPDESVKLQNLSRKQRAVCMQVAKDSGLWSSTQGSSLLVLREGPFTEEMRKEIANLPLASGLRLLVSKVGPGLVLLGRMLTDMNGMRMSKACGKCPSCCDELSLPAESPASRSLMDFGEEDGYDVDIFNDQGSDTEIKSAIEAQLADLEVDAMFDYPAGAGQAGHQAADFRRQIAELVCALQHTQEAIMKKCTHMHHTC